MRPPQLPPNGFKALKALLSKHKLISSNHIVMVVYSCESFPLVGNELFDEFIIEQLQMLICVSVGDVYQSRTPVYNTSPHWYITVINSLPLLRSLLISCFPRCTAK